MKISKKAFDMTVAEEVTSKAYYIKHYQRPEWPGVSSGVTVGIGYDLGQSSRDKIRADWERLVDPDMLMVMMLCSGVIGRSAEMLLPSVKNKILIPWDAAISVFETRDVPSWTAAVLNAVPGAEKLSPSCLGVLFDLAYNRGCSFNTSGDRYREMRAIRDLVKQGRLAEVPRELTGMKRLWPNVAGLQRRCDHRKALWQEGMAETGTVPIAPVGPTPTLPDPAVPLNEGAARTKPPATSTAQNTTAGAIVVGGVVATQRAASHGLISTDLAIFLGFLAALAALSAWLI